MNSARYNSDSNGKVRWGEDGDGAGVEGDCGDDLDDARADRDDDEEDLPFLEDFSPAESARRKGLFFFVGFRRGAAAESRKLFCPHNF